MKLSTVVSAGLCAFSAMATPLELRDEQKIPDIITKTAVTERAIPTAIFENLPTSTVVAARAEQKIPEMITKTAIAERGIPTAIFEGLPTPTTTPAVEQDRAHRPPHGHPIDPLTGPAWPVVIPNTPTPTTTIYPSYITVPYGVPYVDTRTGHYWTGEPLKITWAPGAKSLHDVELSAWQSSFDARMSPKYPMVDVIGERAIPTAAGLTARRPPHTVLGRPPMDVRAKPMAILEGLPTPPVTVPMMERAKPTAILEGLPTPTPTTLVTQVTPLRLQPISTMANTDPMKERGMPTEPDEDPSSTAARDLEKRDLSQPEPIIPPLVPWS